MINATNLPARHEDMEMPFILKAVLYIVLSIVAFLSVIGNTLEIITFLDQRISAPALTTTLQAWPFRM